MQQEVVDMLAGLALFADLSTPERENIVQTFDESWFNEGERVIRQGMSGSAFYVILEGTATIRVDGVDRGTIRSGDYFGEISSLLGELPTADIVAQRPLRCLALPGAALEPFPHGRYPVVIVGSGPCSGAG